MTEEYRIASFQCAMCGNCCRGEGYVRIRPDDARRIARHLGLELAEFHARYCREAEMKSHREAGDVWLVDKGGPDLDCIFLEGNLCSVNDVKPEQCLGFPTKWRTPDIMDYCVGMQREP